MSQSEYLLVEYVVTAPGAIDSPESFHRLVGIGRGTLACRIGFCRAPLKRELSNSRIKRVCAHTHTQHRVDRVWGESARRNILWRFPAKSSLEASDGQKFTLVPAT